MKKCSYCGAEYPDDAVVCPVDQTPFDKEYQSIVETESRVRPRQRAMKVFSKSLAVILVLYLELAVLQVGSVIIFGPSHDPIGARYRHKERLAAYFDSRYHPSPETKAAFEEELRLMHKHEYWKGYLALGLFFAINGVWIYYYLRFEFRKKTAC